MAEYCLQCNKRLFKTEKSDFKGLVSKREYEKKGVVAKVLCEGCGWTLVNHLGECIEKVSNGKRI